MTSTISPIAPPALSASPAPIAPPAPSALQAPIAPPALTARGRVGGRVARTANKRRLEDKHLLGGYTDGGGRKRVLIAVPRWDGCVLVVDRDSLTLSDRRLVACIAPEESQESTAAVCALYLSDTDKACRPVDAEDLRGAPTASEKATGLPAVTGESGCLAELTKRSDDGVLYAYRLELAQMDHVQGLGEVKVQLCWRKRADGIDGAGTPVSLREVVGGLESYEPACELTSRACATYGEDLHVASTTLQNQLLRLRESPIVLNRGLREAVVSAGPRQGLSMSEIALRCGRVKRAKGAYSGETSWLARRVGIMPESGTGRATPWVHSDVLALIARDGLGVSPREVELG